MGGFHYLMMLYFLYSYSVRIEREEFAGKPADMAFMLLTVFGSSSKYTVKSIYFVFTVCV